MVYNLQYKPFGKHAILIEWPQDINETILKDIINFKTKIESESKPNIEDLIIGYNSLTIKYIFAIKDFSKEVEALKLEYLKPTIKTQKKAIIWQIPVCYDKAFGIDLKKLSEEKKCTIEDIINMHCKTIYTVYFIGFLPGFLYLGGLNNKLYTKRKATPKLDIKKGAVAIGGKQTGIYPSDSAGGWHVIGQTPASFFNINKNEPCFAKPGDKIKFVSITKAGYFKLQKDIENKVFKLKSIADD